MASSVISNPVTNSDRSRESSKRKKKKKNQIQSQVRDQQNQSHTKWKTHVQQQLYSSKLVLALRQVRLSSSNETPRRGGGRAIREAADRALAVAAKGRTRWSRAILTNRLKLKFMKHKRQRVKVTGQNRSKKPKVSILRLKGKTLPAVQRKVRVLGRLVPGCRKLPLQELLEEVIDYIPALEMQIRTLNSLLSTSTSTSGAGASNPSSRPPPS